MGRHEDAARDIAELTKEINEQKSEVEWAADFNDRWHDDSSADKLETAVNRLEDLQDELDKAQADFDYSSPAFTGNMQETEIGAGTILEKINAPTENGEPYFDPNDLGGPQSEPDCEIRSEQHILKEFGFDSVTEDELLNRSVEREEYDGHGTVAEDFGHNLNEYGIGTELSYNNTLEDVKEQIDMGHSVILGVDADELYSEPGMERYIEQVKDLVNGEIPNHALCVEDVDFDNKEVSVFNPATGLQHDIPFDTFQPAWDDSNNLMLNTDISPEEFNNNLHDFDIDVSDTDTDTSLLDIEFDTDN